MISLLDEKGSKKSPIRSIWAWICLSCLEFEQLSMSESVGWFSKYRPLLTVMEVRFGGGSRQ